MMRSQRLFSFIVLIFLPFQATLCPLNKVKFTDDFFQRLNEKFSAFNVGIAEVEKIKVSVHPNPVTDQLLIYVDSQPQKTSLRIYDIAGRIIFFQREISANLFLLNCKNFSPGIYFYQVDFEHRNLFSGKFVKQ